jgi:hypothetical protein
MSTPPMPIPDRARIRSELAAMRVNFHVLLDSLSDTDWRCRAPISGFSVRELVVHLMGSLGDHSGRAGQCAQAQELSGHAALALRLRRSYP